jgi:hypothetical protein
VPGIKAMNLIPICSPARELVVDRIDALPARFRVGLFSAPGTFPLVARAGIAKDPSIGFAVERVSVDRSRSEVPGFSPGRGPG